MTRSDPSTAAHDYANKRRTAIEKAKRIKEQRKRNLQQEHAAQQLRTIKQQELRSKFLTPPDEENVENSAKKEVSSDRRKSRQSITPQSKPTQQIQLDENMQKRISELEAFSNKVHEELKKAYERNQKLYSALKQLTAEKEETNSRYENLEKEFSELKSVVSNMKKDIKSLKKERKERKARKSSLTSNLEASSKEKSNSRTSLSSQEQISSARPPFSSNEQVSRNSLSPKIQEKTTLNFREFEVSKPSLSPEKVDELPNKRRTSLESKTSRLSDSPFGSKTAFAFETNKDSLKSPFGGKTEVDLGLVEDEEKKILPSQPSQSRRNSLENTEERSSRRSSLENTEQMSSRKSSLSSTSIEEDPIVEEKKEIEESFGGYDLDAALADADAYGAVETVPCPSCGRGFNADSLERHRKVCKKVFQKKRRVFKVNFIEDEDGQGIVKRSSPKRGQKKKKGTANKKKGRGGKKKADWRKQSSDLREAMRLAREATREEMKSKK